MPNKPKLSRSGVSWTDYSWGIVDGCTKVSEACKNGYAEAMVTRFQPGRKFSEVRVHTERLEAPLNTKKGGKVFVAPLGDLFHEDVPFDFIDKVFAVMALAKWHTFQILTKRPDRMAEYFKGYEERVTAILDGLFEDDVFCAGRQGDKLNWNPTFPLPNVWIGTTVENNEHRDRIEYLLQCPAAIRFVSIEPMLGPVDLMFKVPTGKGEFHAIQKLDWVVLGGESGPHARPMHPDDARSVRDQCVAAGVKFYFKQWGEWVDETHPEFKPEKYKVDNCFVKYDGNGDYSGYFIAKVGTKRAGCLLDGCEWKQFPEVGNDR